MANGHRHGHSQGYIGLVLGLASTILYVFSDLVIKLLPNYNGFTICSWRFLGCVPAPILLLAFHTCVLGKEQSIANGKDRKKRETNISSKLRALLGCVMQILYVFALQSIGMGDAATIFFSSSVFVPLLAHFLLGEKTGPTPIACALLTLLGVAIIAKPSLLTGAVVALDQRQLIGTGLALSSMIVGCFYIVLLRYLRQVHYSLMMLTYGLMGFTVCTVAAYSYAYAKAHALDHDPLPQLVPQGRTDLGLTLILATLTCGSQLCVTLAYKYERAGLLTLLFTLSVPLAFCVQVLFLGVEPDVYSLVGSAVVVVGVLLLTIQKFMEQSE